MSETAQYADKNTISLRIAVYCFVVLCAMIVGFSSFFYANGKKQEFQLATVEISLQARLNEIELGIAHNLDSEWLKLKALSAQISANPASPQRELYDMLTKGSSYIDWVGRTNIDGKVMIASGWQIEGQNLAAFPWYQRTNGKRFADLITLEDLPAKLPWLKPGSNNHYVVFSLPVTTQTGEPSGMINALVSIDAIMAHTTESAKALNLDAFLVAQTGTIIASTTGSVDGSLDLESMRIAATGVLKSQIETWADGQVYATNVIPQISFKEVPNLGWRLIGRINPNIFAVTGVDLYWSSVKLAVILFCVITILSILFVQIFIVPLQILASNAERIADGHEEYPFEGRLTSEVVKLSAALVRLKSQHEHTEHEP